MLVTNKLFLHSVTCLKPGVPAGSPKPSQVERYSDLEFMEKVGAGGFGAVSRGRWIPADKIVAIKTSMEFDEREVIN